MLREPSGSAHKGVWTVARAGKISSVGRVMVVVVVVEAVAVVMPWCCRGRVAVVMQQLTMRQ